jgi:uncharacterized protein
MTLNRVRLIPAILLLAITAPALLFAQETRKVVHHPATPADAQPNSSKVPDVYAITGHFDRIVILRLKYKTDLLAGLKQGVKMENIRDGVILAGIGSVRGYHIHQVTGRNFPTQDTYEENPTQPADLVSMNGYITNGLVHAHLTLALPDRALAGHLEPGTQVYTFAIVTIGVMNESGAANKAGFTNLDNKNYR